MTRSGGYLCAFAGLVASTLGFFACAIQRHANSPYFHLSKGGLMEHLPPYRAEKR